MRDLLRKNAQPVRQRTTQILSVQNLMSRNTGRSISEKAVKQLDENDLKEIIPAPNHTLAITSNLEVMRCLNRQISHLGKTIKKQTQMQPEFKALLSMDGMGIILGVPHFSFHSILKSHAPLSRR